MRRTPPHILVTTPESLYILLTSASGRAMLATVRTVIVDEIHAVAGTKRGAHLALSLERLALCASAARAHRPVGHPEAHGAHGAVPGGQPRRAPAGCEIVDAGSPGRGIWRIELPASPLTPVMANEVWEEIYDRLAELVREHRTTLVFVNTRAARGAGRPAPGGAARRGRRHRAPRQPGAGASAATRSSGSRRAAARRWWPPLRWSWASTSATSTWSARSARRAHRHVPAARGPLGPRRGPAAQGPAVPAVARRPGGVRGAAGRRAPGGAGRDPACRARRWTCWPSRSWPRSRLARVAHRRPVRAGAPRLALPRPARGSASTRWCTCSRTASPPAAAGAAPTCTTTR